MDNAGAQPLKPATTDPSISGAQKGWGHLFGVPTASSFVLTTPLSVAVELDSPFSEGDLPFVTWSLCPYCVLQSRHCCGKWTQYLDTSWVQMSSSTLLYLQICAQWAHQNGPCLCPSDKFPCVFDPGVPVLQGMAQPGQYLPITELSLSDLAATALGEQLGDGGGQNELVRARDTTLKKLKKGPER